MNIIALILANLPTILAVGEAGYKFVQSVRTSAQQTGEWTPAIEAQYQATLAQYGLAPEWQPDSAS